MHEISLVQGLFEQLAELAEQNNMTKVVTVTMQIGPLSGVVEDSFRFGFDVLSRDNDLLRDAKLILHSTSVTYRCTSCQTAQESTTQRPDSCEHCGENFLIAEGGDELILQQVEME